MVVFSSIHKYLFSSILIISISNPSFACGDRVQNVFSSKIYQHWIHSYEEDIDGLQVYRSSEYQFPPSRGREGFEIKENRQFILYTIGPTDRPQAILGHWEKLDETTLKVLLKGRENQALIINIIDVSDQYLKIIKTWQTH